MEQGRVEKERAQVADGDPAAPGSERVRPQARARAPAQTPARVAANGAGGGAVVRAVAAKAAAVAKVAEPVEFVEQAARRKAVAICREVMEWDPRERGR